MKSLLEMPAEIEQKFIARRNLNPIHEVSYSNTHGKIFQYAAAGVAVDISQDDVTGDCAIVYKTHHGETRLTRTFDRTQRLIELILQRYPMKPFRCEVDY